MGRAPTVYYTHAGSLAGIERIAAELGRDLQPMLGRHGIACGAPADVTLRVSYPAVCALLESCAREWQCPDLGLRMGEHQSLDFLGPVGLLARLTDTVGQALSAFEANLAIHSNAFDTLLEQHAGIAAIHYLPHPRAGCTLQMIELSLCRIHSILGIIGGTRRAPVRRVCFSHPAGASRMRARRFFGAPVEYGAASNALHFDAAWLATPTAVAERSQAPLVEAFLAEARRSTDADIVSVTMRLIGRLLTTGRCTRENVAGLLHLHPRTYQRRLAAQGTTFARLLDSYRRDQALELVAREGTSLASVAHCLGYADQSAFTTAFRRWTATNPRRYRNRLA